MSEAVVFEALGIKCDALACTFADESVSMTDYGDWLNRSCPLCGANLLTEGDYQMVLMLQRAAAVVNAVLGDQPADATETIIPLEMDGTGALKIGPARPAEGGAS